jgi:membrane-associated HD superfamily phosphohydrolase
MNPFKSFFKKVIRSFFFLPTGNGRKDRSWLERVKTPSFQKGIIGIGTALILAFLLSPSFQFRIKGYKVGDVATKEVKSVYDLLVEDVTSTQEKRLEAERWVLSIYDYDPTVLTDMENRIRSISEVSSTPQELEKGSGQDPSLGNDLDSSLRSYLSQKEWQILERKSPVPPGRSDPELLSPLLQGSSTIKIFLTRMRKMGSDPQHSDS